MAASKLFQMQAQSAMDFPDRLEERCRPGRIEDFIGLEIPKRVMAAFMRRPMKDAFYFVGPSGVGKTAFAKAVIDTMNAEEHHIPARSCDLETIDATIAMCHRGSWQFYGPNAGKPCQWHAVHVSEADQMTGGAQLRLLSNLDSTAWPPNTFFILTANSTQLLEVRFLSRCKVLDFEAPNGNLPDYLRKIYKREGGTYPVDFAKIALLTAGNVRDALGKIETELMIGADRKGLPKPQEKAQADHTHKCGECHIQIDCNEKDCRKQAIVKVCPLQGMPPCAGTTPERAERGRRAWQTRREKK